MTVPMAKASTNEISVSSTVTFAPSTKVPRLSRTTCSVPLPARLLVPVDGRGFRRLQPPRRQVVLERLLPLAALIHLLEPVVEEGPEGGVALLQADPVRLVGERGVD